MDAVRAFRGLAAVLPDAATRDRIGRRVRAVVERAAPAAAPTLDDPVAFAHALYGDLAAGGDPRLVTPTPTSYGAFVSAVRRLAELLPEETGYGGAVAAVDEAGHTWANTNHAAGVAFGVAAERLRRSLARLHWDQDAAARASASGRWRVRRPEA